MVIAALILVIANRRVLAYESVASLVMRYFVTQSNKWPTRAVQQPNETHTKLNIHLIAFFFSIVHGIVLAGRRHNQGALRAT